MKPVLMPIQHIGSHILVIRGHRVMLDIDLADLYGVPTKRLNEQVKRNADRFPEDFMFRLTRFEVESLNRSQIATGSQKHRDPRFPPFAFTEHGAIQAANVLNSPRAVEMGLYVVRAFVRLREFLATNKELAAKLTELEHKLATHDQAITGLIDTIRQLMTPPPDLPKRPIGFVIPQEKSTKTKGKTAKVKQLIAKHTPLGVQLRTSRPVGKQPLTTGPMVMPKLANRQGRATTLAEMDATVAAEGRKAAGRSAGSRLRHK